MHVERLKLHKDLGKIANGDLIENNNNQENNRVTMMSLMILLAITIGASIGGQHSHWYHRWNFNFSSCIYISCRQLSSSIFIFFCIILPTNKLYFKCYIIFHEIFFSNNFLLFIY